MTNTLPDFAIRHGLETVRFAVVMEENGKSFFDSAFMGSYNAQKRAEACVDDALPRNTVAVYIRTGDNTWELWGRAALTGDGGTEFKRWRS